MVTEAEARGKTCHRTLAAVTIAGEANFYPAGCVASECMAWRWHHSAAFKLRAEAAYKKTGERIGPTEGYCGLAGAPSP